MLTTTTTIPPKETTPKPLPGSDRERVETARYIGYLPALGGQLSSSQPFPVFPKGA